MVGRYVRIKTVIVFCLSKRLPKVTARPFSLRTLSSERVRIVSCEGISRGQVGGIGVGMREKEKVWH